MNRLRTKRKAWMLSLGLLATMSSTPSVQAQGILGDLLDDYYAEQDLQRNHGGGVMGRGTGTVGVDLTGQGFGATNGDITGQTFGAPLGSGLFVMLAAGAGYATIKSSKKQNRKEK